MKTLFFLTFTAVVLATCPVGSAEDHGTQVADIYFHDGRIERQVRVLSHEDSRIRCKLAFGEILFPLASILKTDPEIPWLQPLLPPPPAAVQPVRMSPTPTASATPSPTLRPPTAAAWPTPAPAISANHLPSTTSVITERSIGPLKCPMGRDYWLGFPNGYNPAHTYWLVVAVHGHNGRGDAMKNYALKGKHDDYIVVAPTFPDNPDDGFYQVLEGKSDLQLIELVKKLKSTYKLQPKIFLYGFSGGSQYSHRFTMAHHDLVAGCSAHSGGTWGPHLTAAAADIPMFFSCGLDDIALSGDSPLPRISCAVEFFGKILHANLFSKLRYWEGVGHGCCGQVANGTAECFDLATSGMFPNQRAAAHAELARIDDLIASGKPSEARAALAALPGIRLPEPAPKSPTWAKLTADQRTAQRASFVSAGIGGNSKLGKEIWIDDHGENEFGWNVPAAAASSLAERRRAWLNDQVKSRLNQLSTTSQSPL